MGAQLSTQDVINKTVVDTVNNVLVSMSSTCSQASLQTQTVSATAGGDLNVSDVSQEQQTVINLDCLQSSTMDTQFQNQVAQQLTSQLTAQLSGQNFGLQSTSSSQIADTSVKIATNIKIDDLKSCVAMATQQQQQVYKAGGNIVLSAIKQSQMASVITNCVQKSNSTQTAVQALANTVDNKASTSIAGVLNVQSSAIAGAVSCCCVIVLVIGGLKLATTAKNSIKDLSAAAAAAQAG